MTEKLEMLYEGKAKKVYKTSNPDHYIVDYKDDATAFNGLKKGTIVSKGFYNNQISAIFFELLAEKGIPTHFVKLLSEREAEVKAVEIILVEVVVRNITAGTLAKRIGYEEGVVLNPPVLEFYYKNDDLGDPMINQYHIKTMNLATEEEMAVMSDLAFKINDILIEKMNQLNIDLVDFKLEFGRFKGQVILADEISPDTCRFWDKSTHEKMDKDRFRRDLGKVEEAYQEVLKRLQA